MKILFGLFKLDACELHGNLTQVQRLASLELFKSGKANFLLATDLASRGLDIAGVKTVINFDMPKNYQVYVHRIGRTARAGKEGKAVSLIGEADRPILKLAIEYSTSSVKHRIIPPAILTGIESQIAAFEEQIADINEMELQEKELNQAQMQLNKVKNCLVHQEEIQGRPRKTWFQTVAETLQEKSKGKPEVAENEKPKVKRGPLDGLSRHKKRLKIGRMEDKKEMASQKASAKIQKKKSRPDRLNASKPSSSGGKGKGQKSTGKRSLFSKEIRKKA